MNDARPSAPAKQDPESLVLRGRPRQASRIRRSVVVSIAAVASASIAGAAWVALQPPTFRIVAGADERPDRRSSAPPDSLARAPGTYGDIPQLGPPLPGDLGRPILEHQRAMEDAQASSPGNAGTPEEERRAALAQQRLADQQAARQSAILFARPAAARVTTTPPGPVVPVEGATETAAGAPGPKNSRFAFLAEKERRGDVNPDPLTPPPEAPVLSAGSIIPASLLTGLNSDLPGIVTAQVTSHVFDSVTGKSLLIPQGSRLIGSYDSVVAYGQRRALVAWRRILFPDGSSVRIDNWQAADRRGFSGLQDKVDRHTFELLKGVVVSSLLGLGTSLTLRAEGGDLLDAMLISAQQNGGKASDQIVSKSLEIQPTVTVRPGWPLIVVVHQDLQLKPWPEV